MVKYNVTGETITCSTLWRDSLWSQRRQNNININFLDWIPDWRTPGKELFFFFSGPNRAYQALLYSKNTGSSSHKLL